jgi:hypothetical protein
MEIAQESLMNSGEEFSLRETNSIQAWLIEDAGGEGVALDWIKRNSANFRTIIQENPHLPDLFRNNPENFYTFMKTELEKRMVH